MTQPLSRTERARQTSGLVNATEMAVRLRCGVRTVHAMATDGRIPFLMVGRRRFFEPECVLDALRQRMTRPTLSGPWSTIGKPCEHLKVEAMQR
jgi:excisionase family DNA binding protein